MDKKLRKIVSQIVENIKAEYNQEKIILYGSFAYGNPDENSDLDLLIIKKTSERSLDRRVRIRRTGASALLKLSCPIKRNML